jgi:hypothetical protein
MLDANLAALYGVSTTRLNQAIKRNRKRFPSDFMFRLTAEETKRLISQIVTPNRRGGRPIVRRFLPYAFTEQGVAMLSSVLNGERAVFVNIAIMRAFVKLRQLLATNADLSRRFDELEKKYDKQFQVVFEAIRQLMIRPDEPSKPPVGFHTESKKT